MSLTTPPSRKGAEALREICILQKCLLRHPIAKNHGASQTYEQSWHMNKAGCGSTSGSASQGRQDALRCRSPAGRSVIAAAQPGLHTSFFRHWSLWQKHWQSCCRALEQALLLLSNCCNFKSRQMQYGKRATDAIPVQVSQQYQDAHRLSA